jgi:hypothetical protein
VTLPAGASPAPTSLLLCSPWATYADIPAASQPLLTEQQWSDVLEAASNIVWMLSARQWSGGGCRARYTPDPAPCDHYRPLLPQSGDLLDPAGRDTNTWCACNQPARFRLPDRAGVDIESVTVDGTVLDPALYYLDRGWLTRTDTGGWPLGGDRTVVIYTYGLPPPDDGKRAVVALGIELAKARAGDSTCRLPARVTSVTRQGVTLAMLDPLTMFDKGRTGLYEVDLFLTATNPTGGSRTGAGGTRRRSGIWSPDRAPRGRRTPL